MPTVRRLHGFRKLILYVPLVCILAAAVVKVSPLARNWMIHFANLGFTRVETVLPALALTAGITAMLLGPFGFYLEPLAGNFLGLRTRWTEKKCKFCGKAYYLSTRISWTNDLFCSSRCMKRAGGGKEWTGPTVPEAFHRLTLALKAAACLAAAGAVACGVLLVLKFLKKSDAPHAETGAVVCAVLAGWLAVSGRGLRRISRGARRINIATVLVVMAAAPAAMLFLRYEMPPELQAPFAVATVGQTALPVLRYALLLWTLFSAWSFWYLASESSGLFAKAKKAQKGDAESV